MPTINKSVFKKIISGILLVLVFPLLVVLFKVIFIYGNYVGTEARIISEYGICK